MLAVGATCDGETPDPPVAGPTGTPSPSASPPDEDGGAFYTFLKEPQSIDPGFAVDAEDLQVVAQVFDSLTAVSADLEVVPAAARSWDIKPDATVFTFHLRRDATFHDGSPVDAASFVRAWRRIVDRRGSQTPSAALYLLEAVRGYESGDLDGVEALDDTTLRVTLSYPLADFPAVVSHPALAPVPRDAVDDEDAFGERPIGNGPFELAGAWEPEQYVRLQAFADHYGPAPDLEQIVFKIYPGDSSELDGYEDFVDGELDVSPVPEGREVAAEREFGAAEDGVTGPGVLRGTKLITAFYGFNTRIPPFDDPTVRQALSLLIDRDAIAEEVLEGARVPARSVVPPGLHGYEPPACDFCDFDP